MSHRLTSDKKTLSLDAIRDMADDIVTKSHDILSRADACLHHHTFYTTNVDNKWTSRKARIISVILFAISISVCAVGLGMYYTYMYHPKTDRLFQNRH